MYIIVKALVVNRRIVSQNRSTVPPHYSQSELLEKISAADKNKIIVILFR